MPANRAAYRSLKSYKYQLMADYTAKEIIKPEQDISTSFIELDKDGTLTIKNGYAWDGPSGPTIDTKTFMRGSLVHDALYQLMRGSHLDYIVYRAVADDILKRICREDGMCSFRAWYVHLGVCLFGEKNARPAPDVEDEIIWVP